MTEGDDPVATLEHQISGMDRDKLIPGESAQVTGTEQRFHWDASNFPELARCRILTLVSYSIDLKMIL